jgi:hypothetical protein
MLAALWVVSPKFEPFSFKRLKAGLGPTFYDDANGMMSVTSKIVFKDVTGLVKAFANLNMILLDRQGRHKFHGIVKTLDGLNGGL